MSDDEIRLWFEAVQEARRDADADGFAFFNLWIDSLLFAAF
jgi:hypothetical protein